MSPSCEFQNVRSMLSGRHHRLPDLGTEAHGEEQAGQLCG
jgi:hypothetical protein